MKLFKRTAGILLAMIMTVLFTTTVFADLDVTGHQYEAYQIFSGTQDGTDLLCDIDWGINIKANSEEFLKALKDMDAASYTDCKTAEDVAKVLAAFTKEGDEQKVKAFAKLADHYKTGTAIDLGVYTGSNGAEMEAKLTAGYYLIVDITATDDGTNTVKNLSLLQMTKNGGFEINNKTDIPKVEKKVKEESYKATGEVGNITNYALEEGYNDIADYDIGDDVPFMLIGTMPTTLSDYAKYKYIFHDTLSKGLTYNEDVKVYLDNGSGQVEIKDDCYSVVSEGTKLTISFANVKNVKDKTDSPLTVSVDSKVIVKYTAKLNDNAVIGLDGNPNEVYLEYSNNPNYIGNGDSSGGTEDETGNTEIDKVIVFTYELDVIKEDNENSDKKLNGAEFILQNENGLYYNKDAEGVKWVENKDDATILTSNKDGKFIVKGIDDGEYVLTEIKAPAGYNKLKKPITLTITALTSNGQDWNDFVASKALTALSIAVEDVNATAGEGNTNTGIVNLNVKNSKGSILPETGGIGTVAIYTIGTLLVVVAGVLLITKKRMSK